MSINWVMLDTSSKSFVPLPGEKILFASPNRTALTLQTPNSYPGKEPLSIKCSDGKATITNQRVCVRVFPSMFVANEFCSLFIFLPLRHQPSSPSKPLSFLSMTLMSRHRFSGLTSGKASLPPPLAAEYRHTTISSKSSSHSRRVGRLISPRLLSG